MDTDAHTTNYQAANDINFSIRGDYVAGNQIIYGLNIQDIEQLPPEAGEPPYQGLRSFDESQARWFFGREQLTAVLLNCLHEVNFLAVVGDSGSGKSSVVRAGVIPALKGVAPIAGGAVPPLGNWQVHLFTPTARPLEKLVATLWPEDVSQQTAVRDQLLLTPSALAHFLAPRASVLAPLLLVIDQFEELFSQCQNEAQRQAFIANIVQVASPTCKIIITLRADFYSACLPYEPLRQVLQTGQTLVGPLNEAELKEAILGPALQGQWLFQAGLVEQLLADVAQEAGALPLLSHALHETWQRRRGRVLTLSGYNSAGGVKKAIAQTAEAVYGSLSAAEQQLAQHIFMELTELNELTPSKDSSRPLAWADVGQRPAAVPLVERLLAARLLTKSERELHIAHEALIREWPRLRGWLMDNRAELVLRRKLNRAAQEWHSQQRRADYLYRPAQLHQLAGLLAHPVQPLSPLEQSFVQASRQQERWGRWQKVGGAAVGVLVLIAMLYVQWVRPAVWRSQAMSLTELVSVPAQRVTVCPPPEANAFLLCPADSAAGQEVAVAAFAIEKYEVSNAQYLLCMQAGACTVPPNNGVYDDAGWAAFPVQDVNALQASAYCGWLGRVLPTELQWEVALDDANPRENTLQPLALVPVQQVVHLSPLGIVNLVGNVVEWTRSYQVSPEPNYEEALWNEQLSPTSQLLLRGGHFEDNENYMRVGYSANMQQPYFGFRCLVGEPK